MTHIHLLAPDFRDDKRPTKLVSKALDGVAEERQPWKYMGANNEKKAKHSDYDLRDLFNKSLQQKVDRYKRHGERFEYTEGFSTEVQTFVKTNYDTSDYDIDFKQLAKQRKEREKQEMAKAQARIMNNRSAGSSRSEASS